MDLSGQEDGRRPERTAHDGEGMEGETPPTPRRKIVIELEDLESAPAAAMRAPNVGTPSPGAPPPSPPLPPVTGIAAPRPAAPLQSSQSGYAGPPRRPPPSAGDFLVGSAAALWKLATLALVALAVGGYLWGGSNAAHERCFMHRLTGDNSLVNTFACVVEH
jgi:hypothetical protein